MLGKQQEAERQMSPVQRAAGRNERSLAMQSARFFRHFGLAPALIGFGGFAYRYLGAPAPGGLPQPSAF